MIFSIRVDELLVVLMEHAPVGKLEGADRGLVIVLERPVAAEQLLGHGFEVFDVERKRQADVRA